MEIHNFYFAPPPMSHAIVPYRPRNARTSDSLMVRTPQRNVRARYAGPGGTVSSVAPYRKLNRRGVANREVNFTDSSADNTYVFNTTGTLRLPFVVPTGTTVSQRTGKKVLCKSLQCRGYVYANSAAIYNDCAILIVYDRRPTGSMPPITDILNTATSISMNNDANSGRFTILKRIDFSMVGDTTSGGVLTNTTAQSADFFVDLKMRPTVYKTAGTGDIGDIEEGAIYAVTVGSNVVGTTAASGVLNFRMRYYDV